METKAQALQAVADFTTAVRALIMNSNDGIKVTGLADKARDAALYLQGPSHDPDEFILGALTLEALERNRGETAEQLAHAIIGKANRFRQIRAKVDGLEDRFKTAIQMAPDDQWAVQTYAGGRQLAIAELVTLGIPEQVLNNL